MSIPTDQIFRIDKFDFLFTGKRFHPKLRSGELIYLAPQISQMKMEDEPVIFSHRLWLITITLIGEGILSNKLFRRTFLIEVQPKTWRFNCSINSKGKVRTLYLRRSSNSI